jgi:protein TonB
LKSFGNDSDKKSIWITILIQGVILVVLYFSVAWKEPFPPIPEYGIELAVFEDLGGGSQLIDDALQSKDEPANETETEPSESEMLELESDESFDDIQEDEEQSVESNQTEDQIVDEINLEEAKEQELIDNSAETISDQTAKEKNQETTLSSEYEEELETLKKNHSEDTANVNELVNADLQEIDERAIYGSGQSDTEGGVQLQVVGFALYQEPYIDDKSDESGVVRYRITVDDEGYVINAVPDECTISPSIERSIYRPAVLRLFLEKTTADVPPTSTGTITFIIKSN